MAWATWIGGLVVSGLAALGVQDAAPRKVEQPLPGGAKAVFETQSAPDAPPVPHGAYEEFHGNGKKRATGRCDRGERTGAWTFWHEDGKLAARGKYQQGVRVGSWQVKGPDGKVDPQRTGEYAAASVELPFGVVAKGAQIKGKRTDRWRFFRRDGSLLLDGEYLADLPHGRFYLHLEDGSVDPEFVSGIYDGATRTSPLPAAEIATGARASSWPAGRALTEGPAAARREWVELRLREVFGGDAKMSKEAVRLLAEARADVLPVVLDALLDSDPADPNKRTRCGQLHEQMLRPMFSGCGFRWTAGDAPTAAEANRRTILRWRALYELARLDDWFFALDLKLLDVKKPALGDPILDFAPRAIWSHAAKPALARPARVAKPSNADAEAAAALDAALSWLVRHQESRGAWNTATFATHCKGDRCGDTFEFGDEPVSTALAIRALLGARTPLQHSAIGAATVSLLRQQHSSGGYDLGDRPQDWGLGAAAAIRALEEMAAVTRHPELIEAVRRGVSYLASLRRPDGGFAFFVSDMSDAWSTCWTIEAGLAARDLGIGFDPAILDGAVGFLVSLTDPESHRTGFYETGSLCPRDADIAEKCPAEAVEFITAMAISTRILAGVDPAKDVSIKGGIPLLIAKPPKHDLAAGTTDYIWWWTGTDALVRAGGAAEFAPWWKETLAAARACQRTDGCAAGSFDSTDVPYVSVFGTRIAATAVMALALEAGLPVDAR